MLYNDAIMDKRNEAHVYRCSQRPGSDILLAEAFQKGVFSRDTEKIRVTLYISVGTLLFSLK